MKQEVLLDVKHLCKTFGGRNQSLLLPFRNKTVKAVDDVSMTIHKGETFGLVGESGCGKSTLARLILSLIKADRGEVWFDGQNVLSAKGTQLREIRRDMQMIFQKPFESLNPRMSVRSIVAAPLEIHGQMSSDQIERRVRKLLDMVGLGSTALNKYPHEFSGGQRQRIGIARAIAHNPKLIVCDEPVSALDVSIQAQILNLLMDLQKELGLTYLFISHDLSVIKHVSNTIGVMYAGRILETASADEIYKAPLHPYTSALLAAVPHMGERGNNPRRSELELSGSGMDRAESGGCALAGRCLREQPTCRTQPPPMICAGHGHYVACYDCKADDGNV